MDLWAIIWGVFNDEKSWLGPKHTRKLCFSKADLLPPASLQGLCSFLIKALSDLCAPSELYKLEPTPPPARAQAHYREQGGRRAGLERVKQGCAENGAEASEAINLPQCWGCCLHGEGTVTSSPVRQVGAPGWVGPSYGRLDLDHDF